MPVLPERATCPVVAAEASSDIACGRGSEGSEQRRDVLESKPKKEARALPGAARSARQGSTTVGSEGRLAQHLSLSGAGLSHRASNPSSHAACSDLRPDGGSARACLAADATARIVSATSSSVRARLA